ncbi:hypothetical protein JHK82_031691 [Glycine max]|nr:hypothetical protein JHK85_032351 [Glycine max]KAG4994958.1 hypothetical protein JHK86_031785 [Glycine max]KAG5124954.1 hypothetical protein JHK82_031691 [Glycine max]KAG5146384.1 hypothetical protein JHK84_031927 [Glycine max]
MKTWKPRCGKQALEEEKKWWEMELNIQRSNLDRLNNCWIKFNYLGDDMVLISGCTKEWFSENTKQEGLLSIFHSIQKWEASITFGNRLTWVRCTGVPLDVWGEECFAAIAGQFGTLVKLDPLTMDMVNLSYAKMLAKLSSPLHVTFSENIKINGTAHLVRVVEEVLSLATTCKNIISSDSESETESIGGVSDEANEEMYGDHGTRGVSHRGGRREDRSTMMSKNSKCPEGVATHGINVLHTSTFKDDMLYKEVECHEGMSNMLACSKK